MTGIGTVARLTPWYPGRRLGFGGNQPRRLMADWTHAALHGRYRSVADGRSLEAESSRNSTAVLAIRVRGDLIAPREAVESLTSRFDFGVLTRIAVAPVPGTSGFGRHFAWVRQSGAMVDAIASWSDQVVSYSGERIHA